MTTLTDRLRELAQFLEGVDHPHKATLLNDAATRLEEYEKALRPFADFARRIPETSPDALCIYPSWSRDDLAIATALDFRIAASLLNEKEG